MSWKDKAKTVTKKGLMAVLAISILFVIASFQLKEPEKKVVEVVPKGPLTIPEFINEKKVNYSWKYGGKDYTIEETLYQSAHDFYHERFKKNNYSADNLPADPWENYYGMFLETAVNDKTFISLAKKIKNEGLKRGLSDDQMAELTLAFVQAIPYDFERVKKNSASEDDPYANIPSPAAFPYETLYEQKGVCADKSYLTVILLRELGYGAALFEYDNENHMAIGIKCPLEYSTNGTGYCYAETTAPGHKIGFVPEIDLDRKVVLQKKLSYYDEEIALENLNLENPILYQKTDGKTYQAIALSFKASNDLAKTEKYINSLNAQLKTLQKSLDALDKEVAELDGEMINYENNEEYEKYNELVPKYNEMVENYESLQEQYNKKISEYNSNIDYYNKLAN